MHAGMEYLSYSLQTEKIWKPFLIYIFKTLFNSRKQLVLVCIHHGNASLCMMNYCHLFQIIGFLTDILLFDVRFNNCTSEVTLAAFLFSIFPSLLPLWLYICWESIMSLAQIIFIPFPGLNATTFDLKTLQFLSSELCNKLDAIARPSPSSLLTSPLSLSLSPRSVRLVWIVEWETVRACSSFLRVMAAVSLQ